MEKILISLFSVILGFLLSQSVNIVKYLRRPKFKITQVNNGVIGCYTGEPPEEPSEVTLGFHLENCGHNPAKNARIFVSNLKVSRNSDENMEDSILPFTELRRPIDIIPPGESIIITIGKIRSDQQHLEMLYQNPEDAEGFFEADTRYKRYFSARFHIQCDDSNSSTVLDLNFDPMKYDFAFGILDDMQPILNPWEKLQTGT